jgi:hypothetical protein
MIRRATVAALLLSLALSAAAQQVKLPDEGGMVRFAIIGDSGTGGTHARQIAAELAEFHRRYRFDFVLMLGDNIYGDEDPDDYRKKFELPYKALLDAGVKFYAALGNHDELQQVYYKHFNMGGKAYYTFTTGEVQFFALNSNYMDTKQLEWLEKELKQSQARWKVAFMHHPPYSTGRRHGPDEELRRAIEPLFLKYGVNLVLAGHEHFYQRLKPQKGVYYLISGNAAKLRRGNAVRTAEVAAEYDTGYSFTVAAIKDDEFHFQTVTRQGETVDAGVLPKLATAERAATPSR